MDGFIHSIESFGTVDGPGVRFVAFLQGCPLRCKYCHNPDTWRPGAGTRLSPDNLMEQFNKNRPFYRNGGITVTGGEPLLQIDFVIELFRMAKAQNVHTCIDTSGAVYRPDEHAKLDALMPLTDLVLLDIKHIDSARHKALTGMDNANILAFAKYLEAKNVPVWIRHVVISGITDDPESLTSLGRFMGTLRNVKALDVLPYHTLGVEKYGKLGIPYPLEGVNPTSREQAALAKTHILKGYRQSRS